MHKRGGNTQVLQKSTLPYCAARMRMRRGAGEGFFGEVDYSKAGCLRASGVESAMHSRQFIPCQDTIACNIPLLSTF